MSEADGADMAGEKERAIIALLNEPTIRKAAESIEVSERTIHRWLEEPEFRRAYQRARRQAFRQSIGLVQRYAPLAVQTLAKVMADERAPYAAKVSASTALLKFSRESLDLDDLAERIEALEAESMKDRAPWRE